jgi:hypothetical protein
MSSPDAPLAHLRSAEVGDMAEIPFVEIVFRLRGPRGPREQFATDSSYRLFDRMDEAGKNGDHIEFYKQGGRVMLTASVNTLNCYLRNAKGMKNWKRRWNPWRDTKWGWDRFMSHLSLKLQNHA